MSKPRSSRSLIITDDEEVQAEELNPFSFKEFLRLKNQDQTHSEEEDGDRGWSLQCSSSPLSEEETRFSSEADIRPRGGDEEGDEETSMTGPVASIRRSSHKQAEENAALRRTIRELQRRSAAKDHRMQELSEELLQRRRQDQKEAEDLENMVHSVEQNLQLMTKRALKAENSVCKLRVELQQLQVEVESLRAENDSLKAAESQVVMTMRQTAQVASEYLNKMASHAHSSICQLLEEAETLRLVSHLLRSMDKISEC